MTPFYIIFRSIPACSCLVEKFAFLRGRVSRFHILSVRAIDFPHKVTPREVISKEKKLKKFFEKNHVKWAR
jgi:hypothetical protein